MAPATRAISSGVACDVLLADRRVGQAGLVVVEAGGRREDGLGRRRAGRCGGIWLNPKRLGLGGQGRPAEVEADLAEAGVARHREQLGQLAAAHLAAEVVQHVGRLAGSGRADRVG